MSTLHVLETPRHPRLPTLPSRTDLEHAIERTLAQLAELDRRYDHQRGVIEGALHPQPWKDWHLVQLEQRYQRERQPLVQLLCNIHQQLASWDTVFMFRTELN